MNLDEFLKIKDKYIQEAIEFAEECPMGKIELKADIKYIEKLDKLVEIIRGLYQKQMLSDDIAWNTSVDMGVLLGEMIIKKHNYKWIINTEDIPVLETPEKNQLLPITKIYKIIKSEENDEGSPSSFYSSFLALENFDKMSDEEKKKLTTYYHDGKFIPATEWNEEEE